MTSLLLKDVRKLYSGNVAAVSDFNLKIATGEFIILVGPSGCGKSTTLRMIAGLEEITGGELYINSHLMNDVAAKDRDIAMVFQNYALYPHMTVYENMAFGLKMRGVPTCEIRHRVEQATESLGLALLLDRKPKALSGGERQRVALGRALVREPKIFLFDEPLSNLDARLRMQMQTEILQLHKRLGATFIYVTHDQVEAMTMADRIVIMKDGFIQQIGTPRELYENPRSTFVAQFIGTPPMNILNGIIKSNDERVYLEFGKNGQFTIDLPPEQMRSAGAICGQEIIFGIRPEDVHCDQSFLSEAKTGLMDGEVLTNQMTGAETHLYVECGKTKLVSKISSKIQFQQKQSIRLAFDPNALHMFDAQSKEILY